MSVSPEFKQFTLEQLGRVTPNLRSKSMFGGVGIYAGEHFFALIDDDTLYLKVDDGNRPTFEALGMGPFRPWGEGGEVMQYYEVPGDMLDDVERLQPLVSGAIAVAERAKRGRKRSRGN